VIVGRDVLVDLSVDRVGEALIFGSVIDEEDVPCPVDRQDEIGRVFHQRAPFRLRLSQCPVRRLAVLELAARKQVEQAGREQDIEQPLDGLDYVAHVGIRDQKDHQAIGCDNPHRCDDDVSEAQTQARRHPWTVHGVP